MTWQPVTYDPELNLIYVDDRQSAAGHRLQEPRRAPTSTPLDRRAQRRHREDGLVLPVVAARHARLGRDADGRCCSTARSTASRASCSRRRRATASSSCSIATNGKAIVSTEYIKTNWSLGYDEKGQPIPNPAKMPQIAGALVSPNQGGATNWPPPSFSPQTGLFYVNATRAFSVFYLYDAERQPAGLGRHRSRRLRRAAAAEGDRLQDRQDPLEHPVGRRQLRPAEHRRQRALQRRRPAASSRYNATTGEPLWNAAPRQRGHQRADHLRARRPAVRRRRRREPAWSRSC